MKNWKHRNSAYKTAKEFKEIQQGNIIAQDKQDRNRPLGRNQYEDLKHINRETTRGKVFGGMPIGKAQLRQRIRNRINLN